MNRVTFPGQNESLWSNNNAESLNSAMRKEIDFIPKNLDELVKSLETIVDKQIENEKAALHSVGDYNLNGVHRRYIATTARYLK